MQVKQMIFILIISKVQCKKNITSIINYTTGIIQSQVTSQNLVDSAPFYTPFRDNIYFIILIDKILFEKLNIV
ncbi:unnamed protein product [Paramecium primaurelia]|uniref:Uncharacterized protein n=1 Tax=Paramecium primaurelia TaxID=5886 RepID=A0A8S1LCD8_PARPR|nr:unnamed protein product [Paramecium primaurelia]